MESRAIYRLHFVVLGLYIAAAIALWPGLPESIPLHFDLAGEVTDRAPTSILSWFGLPALAVVITLFLLGAARLAEGSPDLWSIPEKKRFLALSPEMRAPIEEQMRRLLAWSAVFVLITFIAVHTLIYMTAIGGNGGEPWLVMLLIMLPTIVLLVMAFRMSARVKEMVLELSGEGG